MKRIVLVISLLYWFSNGFAGDGSKTNPFTPTEVISLVALANGEKQSCDYWVESFIGIYRGYTTRIENGSTRTIEYQYLLLSEEPGISYSSRNPSQYNARNLVMVGGGDNWLQDHSDITHAVNTNNKTKILVHCTDYYRSGGQGFNVVLVDTYEFIEEPADIGYIDCLENRFHIHSIVLVNGQKTNILVKGINIVRMTDGTVKKVFADE